MSFNRSSAHRLCSHCRITSSTWLPVFSKPSSQSRSSRPTPRGAASVAQSTFLPHRSITSSTVRHNLPRANLDPASGNTGAATSGATKDPDHPYLHYHPLPPPSSTSAGGTGSPGSSALSFLPDTPVRGSRTILGYLPAGTAGLGDFQENRDFRDVMHQAVKDGLARGVGEAAEFEAQGRPGDGYIHITDERALPPAGRIGETEDLIGSVFVQDNKIIAETYEPLPSYRLITANGPPVLPKGLDRHLIETLRRIDEQEKAGKR